MEFLDTQNLSQSQSAFFKPSKRLSETPVDKPARIQLTARASSGIQLMYDAIDQKQSSSSPTDTKNYTRENGQFIIQSGLCLGKRYKVVSSLKASGQSAILVQCQDLYRDEMEVIIKVMHVSYFAVGLKEIQTLRRLNSSAHSCSGSHIIRLLNAFRFDNHVCLVFPAYNSSPLTQIFKRRNFSSDKKLSQIRKVSLQLLSALAFLNQQRTIHADLKPENILMNKDEDIDSIVVTDFGNAIRHVYKEISLYYSDFELQTLSYRAPEIFIGLPFSVEIDMWSLGCVLAELYLSKPLFAGEDRSTVLNQMTELLGPLPQNMCMQGKFLEDMEQSQVTESNSEDFPMVRRLMSKLPALKNYNFASFLSGLLTFDPNKRLTPLKALQHPFMTKEFCIHYFLPDSLPQPDVISREDYKLKQNISPNVKRLCPSTYDILRVGTSDTDLKTHVTTVEGNGNDTVVETQPVCVGELSKTSQDTEWLSISKLCDEKHFGETETQSLTSDENVSASVLCVVKSSDTAPGKERCVDNVTRTDKSFLVSENFDLETVILDVNNPFPPKTTCETLLGFIPETKQTSLLSEKGCSDEAMDSEPLSSTSLLPPSSSSTSLLPPSSSLLLPPSSASSSSDINRNVDLAADIDIETRNKDADHEACIESVSLETVHRETETSMETRIKDCDHHEEGNQSLGCDGENEDTRCKATTGSGGGGSLNSKAKERLEAKERLSVNSKAKERLEAKERLSVKSKAKERLVGANSKAKERLEAKEPLEAKERLSVKSKAKERLEAKERLRANSKAKERLVGVNLKAQEGANEGSAKKESRLISEKRLNIKEEKAQTKFIGDGMSKDHGLEESNCRLKKQDSQSEDVDVVVSENKPKVDITATHISCSSKNMQHKKKQPQDEVHVTVGSNFHRSKRKCSLDVTYGEKIRHMYSNSNDPSGGQKKESHAVSMSQNVKPKRKLEPVDVNRCQDVPVASKSKRKRKLKTTCTSLSELQSSRMAKKNSDHFVDDGFSHGRKESTNRLPCLQDMPLSPTFGVRRALWKSHDSGRKNGRQANVRQLQCAAFKCKEDHANNRPVPTWRKKLFPSSPLVRSESGTESLNCSDPYEFKGTPPKQEEEEEDSKQKRKKRKVKAKDSRPGKKPTRQVKSCPLEEENFSLHDLVQRKSEQLFKFNKSYSWPRIIPDKKENLSQCLAPDGQEKVSIKTEVAKDCPRDEIRDGLVENFTLSDKRHLRRCPQVLENVKDKTDGEMNFSSSSGTGIINTGLDFGEEIKVDDQSEEVVGQQCIASDTNTETDVTDLKQRHEVNNKICDDDILLL